MQELVLDVDCFNLKYTLECGQCFRWEPLVDEDNTYIGVIHDRVIKIKQIDNKLYIKSNNMDKLEEVIKYYFDLDVNYREVENKISKIDNNVNNAVKNTTGIRILNQDFFETLISFIISSNNNIPRISKSIKEISYRYGNKVIFENNEYYLFPTTNQLKDVKQEEYRSCGVGFRDRYILKTVADILDKKVDVSGISKVKTEELRNILLTLQGVGPKVADCILLFSCKRKEVFPIDVWVERVMQILYFKESHGAMKKKEILEYATNRFGQDAGIVQQHLFYNIREKMINI